MPHTVCPSLSLGETAFRVSYGHARHSLASQVYAFAPTAFRLTTTSNVMCARGNVTPLPYRSDTRIPQLRFSRVEARGIIAQLIYRLHCYTLGQKASAAAAGYDGQEAFALAASISPGPAESARARTPPRCGIFRRFRELSQSILCRYYDDY